MDRAGSTFLCHSCVKEASLLKGQTQVCVLCILIVSIILQLIYAFPLFPQRSFAKVFLRGLPYLCKLRGKSPEHIKIENERR